MKLKWDTCFKAAVTVFVLYLCIQFWPTVGNLIAAVASAAIPLLIGTVIAYVVNILMSLYERHYFPKATTGFALSSRRPVCMIAAFLTIILVIAAVIWLVVPELTSCVGVIVSSVSDVITDLSHFLAQTELLPEDMAAKLTSIDWNSKINQVLNNLVNGMGNVMTTVISTVSTVFSGIVNGVLGFIFAIYLLMGKNKLAHQCNRLMDRYLNPGFCNKLRYVLGVLHDCFRKYIIGQCTEAVILGTLCALGMAILRLPYASMIGVLIAVTALIPVAGAYIGGAVGFLMIFSVSPIQAVIFLVFLVILQQIEGNVIYPKVVGSSLGLPAIWVLAAVTIGGGIAGIFGMILGVPIAAALYRLLREDLNKPQVSADVPQTE